MATKPVKKKAPPKKGRPSKYSPAHVLAAEMMARIGMTDLQMAARLHIVESTFNKWKKDHPEFADALKVGKAEPDEIIEGQLYRRALGYEYVEEIETMIGMNEEGTPILAVTKRIHKHMPGDALSVFYYLNNRRPDKWRQRQEILNTYDDSAKELAEALSKI